MDEEIKPETILFTVPATMMPLRSHVDKSFTLVFRTDELPPAQAAAASFMLTKHGTLAFVANDTPNRDIFDQLEAPDEIVERGAKSKSERQRNALYVLWKEKGEPGDFDSFYNTRMEQIIKFITDKLPPKDFNSKETV